SSGRAPGSAGSRADSRADRPRRWDRGARKNDRLACRLSLREGGDPAGEFLRLLDVRVMSGALDGLEAGAGDRRTIGAPVGFREDTIGGAPQEERRNPDAVQPALELGVVHV